MKPSASSAARLSFVRGLRRYSRERPNLPSSCEQDLLSADAWLVGRDHRPQRERVHSRTRNKRRRRAFDPRRLRIPIMRRQWMTALPGGHVEVAILFAPRETAKRSDAPDVGPCTRGMLESPGSSSVDMSRNGESIGIDVLNGCLMRTVFTRPQV